MDRGCGSARKDVLHNARFGFAPGMLYPYHPLFGADFEVTGSAGGKRGLVYVRLPDRSVRGIPAWMFDPVACAGVREAVEPVIDPRALSRLAQVVDSSRPEARASGHEPDTTTKGSEEIENNAGRPADAAVRRRRRSRAYPGTQPKPVREPAPEDARTSDPRDQH